MATKIGKKCLVLATICNILVFETQPTMSSNQDESMKANQSKPNITLNDNHN